MWPRDWMPTSVLTSGGTIALTLGSRPSGWGAAPADRPPSLSDGHPLTSPPHIDSSGNVGDRVSMHDSDPRTVIYYTLDGSTPTQAGQRYAGAFVVSACATLEARAFSTGREASPVAVMSFATPLPPSDGTGLLATYFASPDLNGQSVQRVDPVIDFGWPDGQPAPSIGPENFSARWVGELKAPYAADYAISTISDDGIRVWIDGRLVIDNWTDHSPTTDTGHINLEAGRRYSIRIEYFNHADGSACRLMWSCPCLATAVVPQSYLYPGAAPLN
jgi:hypothetical protein